MKALLILGCEGRQDKELNFCSGVESVILDLEKIRASNNYLELVEYLDKVPKLFDHPCCNYSIVSNTLYKVYDLGYMEENFYNKISYFYKMHGFCGAVYIKLIPKDEL